VEFRRERRGLNRCRWIAFNQGGNEDVALQALSELPEASHLDALKANRAVVDLLAGRRWYVMQEAREAGATWEATGDALGITKRGTQDYYHRQIEKEEQLVSDLRDTDRVRAASSR
jgi:hypothetical protein